MIANHAKRRAERAELAGLLFDLQALLERKCKRLGLWCLWGDRGTAATQMVESDGATRLFIMEAGYRNCLYPRVVYSSEDVPGLTLGGHIAGVRVCLKAERAKANRDRVLARQDLRWTRSVRWFNPVTDIGPIDPYRGESEIPRWQRASVAAAELADGERFVEFARESVARFGEVDGE